MDPAAAVAAGERTTLQRLREPLYLVTGEMQVLGDTIAGVFAGPASGSGLELAIDVDRTLIRCMVGPGAASLRCAVGQWLADSRCFDSMHPEDAPLHVVDITTALARILAQLSMAAGAIERSSQHRALASDRFETERGVRWAVGVEAGSERRRAYHDRELGKARASRSSWIDTVT